MIVIEDIESRDIKPVFVVDAFVQLGGLRVGAEVRSFDPGRLLSYYGMVEHQMHDLASRYPGAFKFLPRRSYTYMKRPPILNEIHASGLDPSKASWLADLFFARPLISVAGQQLSEQQQDKNAEMNQRWSQMLPHSPRLYYIQDMRQGRRSTPGWGCVLNAADLQNVGTGVNAADTREYVKSGSPIFVELDKPDDLDHLVKWLIQLKDSKLNAPNLLLSVRSYKDWGPGITRLLEIPDARLLTSGATIGSLSTVISYLRKDNTMAPWSSRLVFGSAYPETHTGDSISEVLSFLFSRNLAASIEDLKRILAVNLLSLLPPRPPFFDYLASNDTVISEGAFGKACLKELARVLLLLAAKGRQYVYSVDHMLSSGSTSVDPNCGIVTLKEPTSLTAASLALLVERDGTLRIAGWRNAFGEALSSRRSDILATLIRASTGSSGSILDSPAHLNQFDMAVLKCLQVKDPQEVLSALHFKLETDEIPSRLLMISHNDMNALGVLDGDTVLAFAGGTGRWWSAKATRHEGPSRQVLVSKKDAMLFGLSEQNLIDLVKYEGQILDLDEAVFAYGVPDRWPDGELSSYVYLHEKPLRRELEGRTLGIGMKVNIGKGHHKLILSLVHANPELGPGQVGVAPSSAISFWPAQVFEDVNIVLCVLTDQTMSVRDIGLKTISSIQRRLARFSAQMPDLDAFISKLDTKATRAELAALISLLTIQQMSANRTEGRLALITVSDEAHKYSIQKGGQVQSYAEFLQDLSSREVLVSLVYSVLDSVRDSGKELSMAAVYRSVGQLLKDFGTERPTLVIVIGNRFRGHEEEVMTFLNEFSEFDRYRMDVLGLGEDFDEREARSVFRSLKARIVPIRSFSAQLFDDYLLSAIGGLAIERPEAGLGD